MIKENDFELKILIVEDNIIESKTIASFLKAGGFGDIDSASNKREALEKIYLFRPDIVLMDISLDEAEAGVEVAELIKNDPEIEAVVIFLTSHTHQQVFSRAKLTEPYGYIIKPFTKESLCVSVEMAYNRKRLELRLKESTQIFKTSVETMLDCFGIFSAVRDSGGVIKDFIIQYLNDSACRDFRISREEMIGRSLSEPLPSYRENGLFEEYCRVVNAQMPLIKHAFKMLIRRSPETFHYYDFRVVDLKDGFAAAWRDVSDRKLAEEALVRSEEKYREIVENLSEGFWLVDNNLRTVFVNKKMNEIIGYSSEELQTNSIVDYIYEDQLIFFHKNIENLRAGVKSQFSLLLNHKNGRQIYVKASLGEFTDNFGGVKGIFAFFNNNASAVELSDDSEAKENFPSSVEARSSLVGNSKFINDLFAIIPSISESSCNVLIEGPSGAGKSLIARTIHQNSERRNAPFVVVNCGALPDALIESELFGYVKGAFTDAKKDKPGKFAMASGGTILLDEIGELPLHLQVKTLHVIEEKMFEPLGSNEPQKVDVRIIAATNKNLIELIGQKKFREDLYYRLKIVNIKVPSLKERREDILLLARHFIKKLNQKYGKNINRLSDNFIKFLLSYNFPGNIRELYNIFEHAFVFSNDIIIDIEQLAEDYLEIYKKNATPTITAGVTPTGASASSAYKIADGGPDRALIRSAAFDDEYLELLKSLELFNNNRNKTAAFLKISRMALWRRMKKYGLLKDE
ncbi:MAG: PAS modulated sigma54 specific transcriptional regulator, fis family [uncultured bacterium]|nr:MAG: PAS modulated sigma54 specific transcriptional regulator, fis family [uncultured bacterium]